MTKAKELPRAIRNTKLWFDKGYEQGKKDQREIDEKDGNKYPTFAFERAFRKQAKIELLEKVLKEVMNEMVMRPQKPKQIPRTVLQPIRAWLEQELKRLQK